MNNKLTNDVKAYIDSLIRQGKVFSTNTIKKHFKDVDTTAVTNYVKTNSKNYITITDASTFVPNKFFATNAATTNKASLIAKVVTSSGKKTSHVSLSSKLTDDLKLSSREYNYSIDNTTNTITVYRNGNSKASNTFRVWKTGRASIEVPSVGMYSLVVK